MGFEGKYSEDVLQKGKVCRGKCKQQGHVRYLGSEVTHGNPYTPAADTEVTHYYRCDNCQQEWEEYA